MNNAGIRLVQGMNFRLSTTGEDALGRVLRLHNLITRAQVCLRWRNAITRPLSQKILSASH